MLYFSNFTSMKQWLLIGLVLIGLSGVAQTTYPTFFAGPKGDSALAQYGYVYSSVLGITAPGDTAIRPKYNGSYRFWQRGDSTILYVWHTTKWDKVGGTATGGGSGTVTSFSAGNLSPFFVSSVATATTTPALTFALSDAAAWRIWGRQTGTTGAPSYGQLVAEHMNTTYTNGYVLSTNGAGVLSWIAAGGSGTVTAFSSGNLSPLFTTSVATSTTTPAQTFALSNATAWQTFARHAGTTGAPSYGQLVAEHLNTTYSNGNMLITNGAGTLSWTTAPTGTVTNVAALTLGTTGTDLSSSVTNGTTTPVITLNVPTASASNRGALSAADWTTFNNKGNGTLTSVSGTTNRITSTGGTTPVIDISGSYVGQSSITTVGTIATGVWNGTGITVPFGGTGLASTTPYAVLLGGTTSTGALQQVSGLGTSTFVLTSNGAGAAPTWQAAAAGLTNPMTTTGDIIYSSSGTGTPARRGIGSTGQTLQVVGGLPTWSTITSYINLIAGGSKSAVSVDAGFGSNGTSGGSTVPGYNLFVVDSSGNAITTGINNVAFGRNTLKLIDAEDYNVAIGAFALENLGLQTSSTGNVGNVAIGAEALRASLGSATGATFGSVAIGRGALKSNTSGVSNTAIGVRAMGIGTSGDQNTAIGPASLESNTGNTNVSIGYNNAPLKTLGNDNILIGTSIMATVTTGDVNGNVFIGRGGTGLGSSSTTGDNNIGIGAGLFQSSWTSASSNIVICPIAAADGLTSGTRNIEMYVAASPGITSGTRNVMIGDQPKPVSTTGTDQVSINNVFNSDAGGRVYINTTSGGISTAPTIPASAQFTIAGSTTGGFLGPKLTTTQQNAISSPATGLEIFNTDYASKTAYNGISWAPAVYNHYIAKTATYSALATDNIIECTSGTFTVTLPTAVGITGKEYTIVNSGAGTITIGTTSSQTFVNFTATPTTLTMATVGSRTIVANGAGWIIKSSL